MKFKTEKEAKKMFMDLFHYENFSVCIPNSQDANSKRIMYLSEILYRMKQIGYIEKTKKDELENYFNVLKKRENHIYYLDDLDKLFNLTFQVIREMENKYEI